MRTVSEQWVENQAAIAADAGRLDAFIESRGAKDVLHQTARGATVVHPGGTNVIGQTIRFTTDFDIATWTVRLTIAGWSGTDDLLLFIYEYDPVSDELGDLRASSVHEITGDLTDEDVVFNITYQSGTDTLAAGHYAFLLPGPPVGTMTIHYAPGDRYPGGTYVSASTHTGHPVMTEDPFADLYFLITGTPDTTETVRRWRATNAPELNNAVDATIRSAFDPSNVTLPIESCSVKIMNNRYRGVG